MQRIPVTLPDGRRFELTPGGYAVCVGDAGRKHLVYDERYMKKLGVEGGRRKEEGERRKGDGNWREPDSPGTGSETPGGAPCESKGSLE